MRSPNTCPRPDPLICWLQRFPPRLDARVSSNGRDCSVLCCFGSTGRIPPTAHVVSCAVVAAGLPEIERIDDLEGAIITFTSSHLSPWRVTQFRRALRTVGLPHSDGDVHRVHEFDSAIRFALLIRIERIELALRGQMASTCATRFGPSWHIDPRAFRPGVDIEALRAQFTGALDRSTDPAARQIWSRRDLDQISFGMVSEHLSLGAISRIAGLLDPQVSRVLAQTFQLPAPTLRATLQHVTHVRNCCAHHTRIWGTRFGVPTPKYRSPATLVARLEGGQPRSPSRSLALISHMADSVCTDPARTTALELLLADHRDLLVGLGTTR